MGSPKKRIQYRYDAVGNRIGMTDPDGGRFTYAYDAVNRITQVINPQGDRTSYTYDAGGRRTVKKLANGTRASFSYDAASNLTRLANLKSDGTTISSFNYEYDRVGNRTAVLEADGSRVTWSYDDTYQLTGEHRSGTTPYEDSYSYDAAGNRLLKIHDGARTTYSYDAANQLEWSEDASGRTTYTFDEDGNQQLVVEPTGDRTTTSWDYENRATLVQLPSSIRNTMAYEPGGLRVKLEESTGVKKFVWDNQNYLAETDENDDTQVTYTNEPRVYGNLVSQRRGTDSHWYQFDATGSTRQLTDATQAVSDTRFYDAWGLVLNSSGSVPLVLAYQGMVGGYHDRDSSQMYMRARYYAPESGRWKSTDALQLLAKQNSYVYALNQPLTRIDPSGRLCQNTAIGQLPNGNFDIGVPLPAAPYPLAIRGHCGTFWWTTEWTLGNNESDGLIVQKVCVNQRIISCPGASPCDFREPPTQPNGNPFCDDRGRNWTHCPDNCYFEVWRVENNNFYMLQPFEDPPGNPPGANIQPSYDSFLWLGCNNECTDGCTHGEISRSGEAYFIPDRNWRPEHDWFKKEFFCGDAGIADACILCSSCYSGTRDAKIKALAVGTPTVKEANVKWDCCNPCGPGCDPACPISDAVFLAVCDPAPP